MSGRELLVIQATETTVTVKINGFTINKNLNNNSNIGKEVNKI